MLRHLASIKRQVKTLETWWNVTGRVYTPSAHAMRDRAPSEYPEVQRLYWFQTIAQLDEIERQLKELRQHCLTEYYATPEDEPK